MRRLLTLFAVSGALALASGLAAAPMMAFRKIASRRVLGRLRASASGKNARAASGPMIGVAGEDGGGPIELLGQHDASEPVRQRHGAKRERRVRRIAHRWRQA